MTNPLLNLLKNLNATSYVIQVSHPFTPDEMLPRDEQHQQIEDQMQSFAISLDAGLRLEKISHKHVVARYEAEEISVECVIKLNNDTEAMTLMDVLKTASCEHASVFVRHKN